MYTTRSEKKENIPKRTMRITLRVTLLLPPIRACFNRPSFNETHTGTTVCTLVRGVSFKV